MARNRTQEFFTAVESLNLRSENSSSRLMGFAAAPKTRGEFTKAASLISKEINETVTKLGKLTALARRKSMFEDKPNEINELIYIIKQDLAKVNHQVRREDCSFEEELTRPPPNLDYESYLFLNSRNRLVN